MTAPPELPGLDSPFALSDDDISGYRRDGFVLLRQVCTADEVTVYRPILRETTLAHNRHTLPLEERDTYGKAFIQVGNLWEKSAAAARFTLARRFGRIAAELMGVKGVRLYHDQALFKEPGGGHTPWHQDQQYWPLDGTKCCTLWMPLVDCAPEMGTMVFASGSQRLGYLGPQNISDESDARWRELIQNRGFSVIAVGAMSAGDATFHDGWSLHGAPGNQSPDTTREVMTVIYVEDGARISEPDSPQRRADMEACFPGLAPGDFAASPLNPVVWRFPDREP
jgi:ectoine hydroxylase-related dioxygenase (phytanoyl-CoA dioxygenase family)